MSLFRFGFAKQKRKSSPERSVTTASGAIRDECSVNAAVGLGDPLPAISDSHSQSLSMIRDPALPINSMSLTVDTEIKLGPIVMGIKERTCTGRCFRAEWTNSRK